MNRDTLVKEMAKNSKLTQKESKLALEAFVEVVQETLKKGEKVLVAGLGQFVCRDRAERQGVNPKTSEKITIAARKVPAFKASKTLKEAVKAGDNT
jgi:DNA-binding protein HU-beta